MKRLFVNLGKLVLGIIIVVGIFKIITYDKCWAEFTKDIKMEYPIIKKVSSSCVGPHHIIGFYTKREINFIEAEKIMFYFMKRIEKENFNECLIKRHKKKTNGIFLYLELRFWNSPEGENHSFVARNKEQFQYWRYKKEYQKTDIIYHVEDYIK